MSATTITNALQTVNAGLSGIAAAPQLDEYPATLTADKLPCALSFPGPSTWGRPGLGSRQKSLRTYVVRVYVAAVGTDVQGAFSTGVTLIETVGAAYAALKTVGTARIWPAQADLEDRGYLSTLRYAGQEYWGFEVRIPLLEEAS